MKHTLAAYSHKIVALRKKKKYTHELLYKEECTYKHIHANMCRYTLTLIFKFMMDVAFHSMNMHNVWRAFQLWAFSIFNLLRVITPDRFPHSVIWLLKTPKRQGEKWETEHIGSLPTEGGGIKMHFRFVKSVIKMAFLGGTGNYD